jgi:hypothetical protein
MAHGILLRRQGSGRADRPLAFDFSRKVFRIFSPVVASGNREADFARLHALFDATMARHPDRY